MTAWRRLTASGLRLAALCPAAYALPADDAASTDAQAAGTGRHAYLDAIAAHLPSPDAREIALASVPADAPHRATCEALDVAELLELTGADTGRVETGLQLEWSPAADEGATRDDASGHRAYRGDPARIYGTADWIITQPDGCVCVVDFKGSERNDPAREHAQLAFYALALARARSLDAVSVALVYIEEDGSLYADRASLDAWDLAAWATTLAGIWRRVTDARSAIARGEAIGTATGEHCARCPAMLRCPAMVTIAREFVATPPAPESLLGLTDAQAGEAWSRVALLEEILDRAKKTLRARAETRGLPLPDGRWLMPVESMRRTVDARRALPVLAGLVGEARAADLVEQSLPASAVDAIAREVAKARGETQKATAADLWETLRREGAVKAATFVSLRPRKLRGAAGEGADDAA